MSFDAQEIALELRHVIGQAASDYSLICYNGFDSPTLSAKALKAFVSDLLAASTVPDARDIGRELGYLSVEEPCLETD